MEKVFKQQQTPSWVVLLTRHWWFTLPARWTFSSGWSCWNIVIRMEKNVGISSSGWRKMLILTSTDELRLILDDYFRYFQFSNTFFWWNWFESTSCLLGCLKELLCLKTYVFLSEYYIRLWILHSIVYSGRVNGIIPTSVWLLRCLYSPWLHHEVD